MSCEAVRGTVSGVPQLTRTVPDQEGKGTPSAASALRRLAYSETRIARSPQRRLIDAGLTARDNRRQLHRERPFLETILRVTVDASGQQHKRLRFAS
jgi:hypothetical protein